MIPSHCEFHGGKYQAHGEAHRGADNDLLDDDEQALHRSDRHGRHGG
jgi:hypothetical protein